MKTNTLYRSLLTAAWITLMTASLYAQDPVITYEQVNICPDQTYYFRGKAITEPGVYTDTLYSSTGEDSIFCLVVNLAPQHTIITTREISDQELPYTWRNLQITKSGTYYDNEINAGGCVDTFRLDLTVYPTYLIAEPKTVCASELPFEWEGQRVDHEGSYYNNLQTIHGYDSIIRLDVTVLPIENESHTITRCAGETLVLKGQTITRSGVYTDTLRADNGCDKIVTYVVNFTPSFFYEDYGQLSPNGQYQWHGKSYDHEGVYYDSLQSQSGCDSIYRLTLTRQMSYYFEQDTAICEQDAPYYWHSRPLYHTGVYYDSLNTLIGGDSIYTLRLTVYPQPTSSQYAEVCEGDSYTWHGKTLTHTGIYTDTLVGAHGCDSIVRLILNKANNYLIPLYAEICEGDAYDFRGRTVTEPGIYYDTLTTVSGCDSVFRLVLNTAPGYLMSQTVNLCPGATFTFRGQDLSESGVYTDSLISSHGCDSVYRVIVNSVPSYYFRDTVDLNNNESYEWHGQTIKQSGTYFDRHVTVNGCDSIYELTARVHVVYNFEETQVVCESELPITWHGKTYSNGGTYNEVHKTADGYDSTYTFHLQVMPTYYKEVHIDFCQEEGATFRNGERFYEARTIRDTLSTVSGCDSIIQYVYTPNPTYLFETDASFNVQNVNSVLLPDSGVVAAGPTVDIQAGYLWRGTVYTKGGVYYDRFKTISGCDSVYKLTLHENPVYYSEEQVSVCSQDLPYVWNNKSYYRTGIYYDSLSTVAGADSVFKLDLTVYESSVHYYQDSLCQGGTFEWHGQTITRPGIYTDTLVSSHGCDSVEVLTFNWMSSYWYVDSVSISDQERYLWREQLLTEPGIYDDGFATQQGCDSTYRLVLTVYPTFHIIDSVEVCKNELPYQWHGMNYETEGIYYDRHLTVNGYDSIHQLNLTILPTYLTEKRIEMCKDNFPYHYKDTTVTGPAVLYDTVRTIHGCDSIFKIIIDYAPSYMLEERASFCRGDNYLWHERILDKPGVFYDSLLTTTGVACDSIYRLELTMFDTYYDLTQDTICTDETPFLWHGQYIFESGTYFDSLRSTSGCDSIYELRLMVQPVIFNYDTIHLCEGDTAFFQDSIISGTSLFCDTMTNEFGCPIISKVLYHFWPSYHIRQRKNVCQKSEYEWHNKIITVEGLYFDSCKTVHGCDSIYEIYVTFHPTIEEEETVVICPDSLPYIWTYPADSSEHTFWRDTVVEYMYRTAEGCDSTYTFTLIITDKCPEPDSIPLCPGDSVYIRDKFYTEPGQYSFQYNTNMLNNYPDSIYRVIIYPAKTFLKEDLVSICSNDLPYAYHDQLFYKDSTYEVAYKSVEGCDSIYRLRLAVREAPRRTIGITICQDGSFYYRGKEVTQPGIYRDTLISLNGCDSILEYVVNRAPTFFFRDTAFITEGGSYVWRNRTFTHSGIYYDSLRTVNGCDSIYSLHLTHTNTQRFHACEGEIIEINGVRYTKDVVIVDTLLGSNGSDSVVSYMITFHPHYYIERTATIMADQYYNFDGQRVHQPGKYYHYNLTQYGCDSTVCLNLKVRDVYYVERDTTICYEDLPYVHNHREYRASVDLTDTLRSALGTDSIVVTHVIIRPKINETIINLFVCENDSVTIRGKRYDGKMFSTNKSDNLLYDTLKSTVCGCDSILHYVVNLGQSYMIDTYDSFCEDNCYFWRGHRTTPICRPGIYFDSLTTVNGCDSIYRLHLTQKGIDQLDTTIIVCQDELPYTYNGHNYYYDSLFIDTLINERGCHDIRRVHYLVTKKCSNYDTRIYCNDELPVIVEGTLVTEAGNYRCYRTSRTGLDSVYRWTAEIAPAYYNTVTLRGSYCDSAIYRGITYYARDEESFIDTLYYRTQSHGCDSIEYVKMTIYKSEPELILNETIPDYETYLFHNKRYAFSGHYTYYGKTIHGCDAIEHLNLKVVPTTYDTLFYDYCTTDGHGLLIFGQTYMPTKDTIIKQIVWQPAAELSAVHVAVVYVEQPFTITSVHADKEVCAEKNALIYLTFDCNGTLPHSYEIEFLDPNLNISQRKQSGLVNHHNRIPVSLMSLDECINPGYYAYRVRFMAKTCHVSDTILQDNLLVRYPSAIMEVYWNNVVALVNETANAGGWLLTAPYQWQVWDKYGVDKTGRVASPDLSQPYLYSDNLEAGDSIIVTLTRAGYSQPIPSCPLIFQPVAYDELSKMILVYPTAMQRMHARLNIEASEGSTYTIYDMTGHPCMHGTLSDGVNTINMPAVAGCFLVDVKSNGQRITRRIILY